MVWIARCPSSACRTLGVIASVNEQLIASAVSCTPAGATSLVGFLGVSTCAGDGLAAVNVTLPSPTTLRLTSTRTVLVPMGNPAADILCGKEYCYNSQLQVVVSFDNGLEKVIDAFTRDVSCSGVISCVMSDVISEALSDVIAMHSAEQQHEQYCKQ